MSGWVPTQHAVEQYVERVDPSADFGRARAAIERAAAGASRLGPAPRGAEKWRAGGGESPAFVAVVDPKAGAVVTVWKGWEANMTGMHGLTWGQLLGVEMTKAGKVPQDIARRGKVDTGTVVKWLSDERAPSNRAASLVYQVLPAMRVYGPQLIALRKALAERHVAEPMTPAPEPAPAAPEPKAEAAPEPPGFGPALRRERVAGGKSQMQLARELGVCNQKIVRWEHERLSPDAPTLERLRAMFPALSGVEPKPGPTSMMPGPRKERARPKVAKAPARKPERRGASPAVKKAAEAYQAQDAAPAPKANGSPVKRWLDASRAVKASPHRAVVLDLLRLAAEAGLGLDDVVEAVA